MKGTMIVFDGGEGGGKTTAIQSLEKLLTDLGHQVVVTREPGGTPVAEHLRATLLSFHDETLTSETELLLMFAARSQHLNNVILPALEDGKIVICDRWTSASYSYQCFGRGMPYENIAKLETMVQGDFRPDMTFVMDIAPEQGMARARKRGQLDRIEQETMDFFHRVRDGFLKQARMHPERFEVVDASRSLEQIKQDVAEKVLKLIEQAPANTPNLKRRCGSSEINIC